MNLRRAIHDEDGFTLLELMISVSLLGLVIGPITTAMLFGLVHSRGTRDRLADSASAQLVSTYFAPDVQSAESVATTGLGACSAGVAAGDVVRLNLAWSDPADGTSTTVLYYTHPGAGALALHRVSCRGSASPVSTLLVHNLEAANPITVTCDATVGSCPTTTPSLVRLKVRAFNAASQSTSYSPFQFELQAKRRTAT